MGLGFKKSLLVFVYAICTVNSIARYVPNFIDLFKHFSMSLLCIFSTFVQFPFFVEMCVDGVEKVYTLLWNVIQLQFVVECFSVYTKKLCSTCLVIFCLLQSLQNPLFFIVFVS